MATCGVGFGLKVATAGHWFGLKVATSGVFVDCNPGPNPGCGVGARNPVSIFGPLVSSKI